MKRRRQAKKRDSGSHANFILNAFEKKAEELTFFFFLHKRQHAQYDRVVPWPKRDKTKVDFILINKIYLKIRMK